MESIAAILLQNFLHAALGCWEESDRRGQLKLLLFANTGVDLLTYMHVALGIRIEFLASA